VASAYLIAVEAPAELSGVFNIDSRNFSVLEVAEQVQGELRSCHGLDVRVTVNHFDDVRYHRVSNDRARDVLRFLPRFDIAAIVRDLTENQARFTPFGLEKFFNIEAFKRLYAAQHRASSTSCGG